MNSEFKKIKKILKLKSISAAQLSFELGYRSPNTVYTWLRNGQVPKVAKERVQKYIREFAA